MLRRPQPETGSSAACAGRAPAKGRARAASLASCAIFARIIITCLTARTRTIRMRRDFFESEPVRPRLQGGRLIYAADQTLQPQRQSSPLCFRQEAAQLALTAVRLDRESARMQARRGAAKFNLCPM